MKVSGEYTCRGTFEPSLTNPKKITLYDGTFTTGYRIKKFVIGPADVDSTSVINVAGKVATSSALDPREWKWEDQREIAWSWFSHDGNSAASGVNFNQVDSNQIIVEDCYVYAEEPGATSGLVNYYIEFEKVDIAEWKGALSMARDRAIGDD